MYTNTKHVYKHNMYTNTKHLCKHENMYTNTKHVCKHKHMYTNKNNPKTIAEQHHTIHHTSAGPSHGSMSAE